MSKAPCIHAGNGGWCLCIGKGVNKEDGSSGNGHVGSGKGGRRSSKKHGCGLGIMKSENKTTGSLCMSALIWQPMQTNNTEERTYPE
jgi:hypothetical protein